MVRTKSAARPPQAFAAPRLRLPGAAVSLFVAASLQASCAGGPQTVAPSAIAAQNSGATPISTRELVELRGISSMLVSPDQHFAVIRVDHQEVASATTQLSWRIIDLRSGDTLGVIDGGDPLWNNNGGIAVEAPQWSADSDWIYFRKLVQQEVQVWRARRDGTHIGPVTHDDADVAAFEIKTDGSLVYAAAGATRDEIKQAEADEYASGVLMDPTVIVGFPVAKSFPVNGRLATYRHIGNAMSGRRGTLLGDRPLRVMSQTSGGQEIPLTGAQAQTFLAGRGLVGTPGLPPIRLAVSLDGERFASVRETPAPDRDGKTLSRSGKRVGWYSRAEGEARVRYCTDVACTDPDSVKLVGWRSRGPELVLQTEAFGRSQLLVWNTATEVVRTLWEGEGVVGGSDSGPDKECQVASDNVICIAAGASSPPRLVSIDLETGQVDTLYDPNPAVSPDRLGVAQKITLKDRYGNTTLGAVILPLERRAGSRLPLVITTYTCRGFLQGGSGRDVPEHVLASLGYAVICIDLGYGVVRRPQGFSMTPVSADLSALDFFEDAIRILAEGGVADPDRVVLSGFSASTTHTTFALTASSKFTAAIVTTGGSFDASVCYLAANYRSCESSSQRLGYPRPFDSRDGILKDSPAWNADKIRAPLLMQLPEAEYREMMQLYGSMREYGRAVEMYVFADAYHYKNNPRQRLAVYDRNIQWIDFWLKGVESARAEASSQNRRWREMRDQQCALPPSDQGADRAMWYCRAR